MTSAEPEIRPIDGAGRIAPHYRVRDEGLQRTVRISRAALEALFTHSERDGVGPVFKGALHLAQAVEELAKACDCLSAGDRGRSRMYRLSGGENLETATSMANAFGGRLFEESDLVARDAYFHVMELLQRAHQHLQIFRNSGVRALLEEASELTRKACQAKGLAITLPRDPLSN